RDPADRDVMLINLALRHRAYQVIIEIACANSPDELLEVKQAYHLRYKRSLEEDVALHAKKHLRQLLVALVSTYRYGGDDINASLARAEANILHEAINGKHRSNHEEIVRILGTRSKAQLSATFSHYKIEHGTSITKDCKSNQNGREFYRKIPLRGFKDSWKVPDDEFLIALHTTIRCINAPPKYFTKVLYNELPKVWTNTNMITRVIVMRAEKDLKEIKEFFFKKKGVTLEYVISGKKFRDYKGFLITLLGIQGH
ncbi:annexin-like protein RJ4, partial [Telopea speciosissima]|uniref:annexin-like protein RJ4 n=1 Tax=Telopea speciosissima TaxID=54955 RepID=UPI001CC7E80A